MLLLWAGDIFDYMNQSNIRMLEAKMKSVEIPYVYVSGNHEESKEFSDGFSVSRIKKEIQIVNLGEILIVGFDNFDREITKEQFESIKKEYHLVVCNMLCFFARYRCIISKIKRYSDLIHSPYSTQKIWNRQITAPAPNMDHYSFLIFYQRKPKRLATQDLIFE